MIEGQGNGNIHAPVVNGEKENPVQINNTILKVGSSDCTMLNYDKLLIIPEVVAKEENNSEPFK